MRDQAISLEVLANKINRERIPTFVVTREPEEDYHKRALRTLVTCRTAEIILNDALHAKMYIAENRVSSLALIASANLTRTGLEGIEAGILIRGWGIGEDLIRECVLLAGRIRSLRPHKRWKIMNQEAESYSHSL
jgi:hypothetical protein